MILNDRCPCCGQKNIAFALSAEDFTVSHEQFEIWECRDCSFRFTKNIPDINEINPYYESENYISHSDTREGVINWLYHKVRIRTLHQKQRLVRKAVGQSVGNILDVGCGTGSFLYVMKQSGWKVAGLEPNETGRRKAKELFNLQLDPPEKLGSLQPESFDAITMWHVLEHVHQLHEYITKFKELLKPGGKLFIAVPNYTCYDAKIYKEFWAAYDVPRHLYHFSPASMHKLLSIHDMHIDSLKPMWYDSFYVSMLSQEYKGGKWNIVKAIIVGAISNLKAMFNAGKCSSVIYITQSPTLAQGRLTDL